MCDPATALMIGGQVLKGIGGFEESKAEVGRAGRRAAQIEFDAEVREKQLRQQQSRRRGATRAAFAKGGVKVKGTAKRLIEEQIRQDELELLKNRHRASVATRAEEDKAASAKLEGIGSIVSAGLGIGNVLSG